MVFTDQILTLGALLLLAGVVASKASAKLGIPALLLFLLLGMLAGSDGPGGIAFDNPALAQSLGIVALTLILFSGGLDTSWNDVRRVFPRGLLMATLGVLVTAGALGLFAVAILGFSIYEGLLLGSIVSSTDAAAVFSVLRSRNVRLRGQLRPLLELESGSNDPMAVFLTVGLISLIGNGDTSLAGLVPLFLQQMLLGAALGYGMGRAMVFIVNRIKLEYDGLYSVLTLALVVFTYGVTALLGGNGFLAVYLAGLVMGQYRFLHHNSLMRFHDGLAWLMQIVMFVTLGLLAFPSQLPPVAASGLLLAAFLILVARPVAVFLVLAFSGFNTREKLLVSWVGLRGAVPIILATFPLVAGLPRAEMYFNLVFFIVVVSTLVQGTTISWVAKRLGVDAPTAPSGQPRPELAADIRGRLTEVYVPPSSRVVGMRIMDLGMPEGALITLVSRNGMSIVPSGGTELAACDTLLLVGHEEALRQVKAIIEGGADGAADCGVERDGSRPGMSA